jgi:hypothetical protein
MWFWWGLVVVLWKLRGWDGVGAVVFVGFCGFVLVGENGLFAA